MSQINFIQNAEHVAIRNSNYSTKGNIILTVNDQEVKLNHRHPIAVTSSLTSPEDAAASLLHGHFVFDKKNNGSVSLKEWRNSNYTGFFQTEEFLDRFGSDESLLSRGTMDFDLPEYGLGGKFNLTAGFTWSAFSKHLKTRVNILRQICSNGIIARRALFQKEVPVINLYDHHLDIAAKQLIDMSRRTISERILNMGREHSTVQEVNLVHNHIEKRLEKSPHEPRLIQLNSVINQYGDIADYYQAQAISKGITRALPSPISRMDLWNIATELNSHTHELVDSTSSALDRIATGLLFPKDIKGVVSEMTDKSTFGSPELAFWGTA